MSAPTQIAHYRITGKLGEGGMGAVYRAVDEKLNREVAVKVLPPALAHDADYIARFQREAQTLAALNHPNIATIFGIEGNAIVMELVEGSTLQGPMPLEEVLPIARQIAEALEAAHDKGIIHRDLKPGNIKLTPEGVVKVLDFGLAKAVSEKPVTTGPNSPTLTMRATEAGLILGTAGYMSPEQAAGKTVDRRADIWSFGVVLYELLTGKRMFDGETVSHTLAHVLTGQIDLEGVPLRGLMERCLDRNLKTRLAHIGEARIAIERYAPEPEKAAVSKPSYLPWAVAATMFAGLCGVSWLYFRQAAPEVRVISTAILPPANADFDFTRPHAMPAISPDGTRIVFGAKGKNGATSLWVRRLDSPTAQLLPGTEGAATPFWSPDSRWVAFGQDRKLRKIDVQGGPPVVIADIPSPLRGGSWNRDGDLVIGILAASPILRVSASGGTPAPITGGKGITRHPWFFPDGRHFLYLSEGGIFFASLDEIGQQGKRLLKTDSPAVFAQGHLLYLRESTLMAQPFDTARMETTGEAVPVAEGVPTYTLGSRIPGFAVSSAGLLAYQSSGANRAKVRLTWRDREGKLLGPMGPPADGIQGVAISPDGKYVAATVSDLASSGEDVWIYEIERGIPTRLTFDKKQKGQSVWSPDGKWVYFTARGGGVIESFRKAANGAGAEEKLAAGSLSSISPDGKLLLMGRRDAILTLPLDSAAGSTKPEPRLFLQLKAESRQAQFSPDGRWVVYSSDESGAFHIYASPFPDAGGKRQISRTPSSWARWGRNGKEIFYVDQSGGHLMTVDVAVHNGSLEIGEERKLFDGSLFGGFGAPFDVSADGRRFLVVDGGTGEVTVPLTLLQNWTVALKLK